MINARAEKHLVQTDASSTVSRRAGDVLERARITKVMRKWVTMDVPAKLLGRGLGRKEIIERVALEVGASVRAVQSALRARLA